MTCFLLRLLVVSPVTLFSFFAVFSEPLPSFYRSFLSEELPAFHEWKKHLIEDGSFIPKSAGPTQDDFNKAIFWALDANGIKIAGFRAFNVSTGCQTGCTPVIFHLMFDTEGKVLKLIQDPNFPLRKIMHQVFSVEDILKLETILKETPRVLAQAREPMALTNNHYGFPPQTFTYYKNTVIKGGAYSTYVILKAALENEAYLKQRKQSLFAPSLNLEATDFNAQIRYLKYLAFSKGLAEVNSFLKSSDLEEKIPEFQFRFLKMIAEVCSTQKHSKTHAPAFSGMQDLEDFASFCSSEPEALEKLIRSYLANKQKKEAAIFYIHLGLYHPTYAVDPSLSFLEKEPFFKELLSKYKTSYLKSKLAEFSSEPMVFPPVNGLIIGSNEPVRLPLEANKKRILFFFAAWCGHCKEMIKKLVREAPDLLDEKIQLIETFSQEHSFETFQKLTGLDTKRWPVIRLTDSNVRSFYEHMSLYAVPRVVVIDEKGAILNFDASIFQGDNLDLIKRDLKWLLSAL